MSDLAERHFLDTSAARLLAAVICLCAITLMALLQMGYITQKSAGDGPFTQCLNERMAKIDGMVSDGLVTEERAALFRSRAEALCRSQHPAN